jgi:pyruvate dehydrogenase E2 component (dihydrolipoamide acetyltransferase)
MARVLRMPGVAANATEAVLAEWLVAESSSFVSGGALATVETDKALVDVEADDDGVLVRALVPAGVSVAVGDPIAVLGAPGETVDVDAVLADLGIGEIPVGVPERRDVPVDPSSASPVVESQPVVEVGAERVGPVVEVGAERVGPVVEVGAERAGPVVEERAPASVSKPPHPNADISANGRVFASPLARRLAADAGLAIEQITGTGPRGRVLKRDVLGAVATTHDAALEVRAGPASTPSYDEIPHSRLRRIAAERLTQSKQQAPHFYVRATVRAEALESLRAEINDGAETRISLNDLVVKAVAAAHRRVPELNVRWSEESIQQFHTADIGVAVATDRGLLTPVVRDVGSLSVTALSVQVRDLADRARAGRLKVDELEGGTIAVTNLGMYGVEEFAAIINPPHAAILAVGAVRDEPVVQDGAVVPGRVMTVTLSVDHRPADGVVAAQWMAALVELLEHPARALA